MHYATPDIPRCLRRPCMVGSGRRSPLAVLDADRGVDHRRWTGGRCGHTDQAAGRGVATYTVDLLERGRRFRWGSDRLGIRQLADHIINPAGHAACTVELSFTMDGPLGSAIGRVGAAKIRSMVDTASLRAAVRQGTGSQPG